MYLGYWAPVRYIFHVFKSFKSIKQEFSLLLVHLMNPIIMEAQTDLNIQPCIIVHGGAWAIPDILKEASVNGVKKAAKKGYDCLKEVKNNVYILNFINEGKFGVLHSKVCRFAFCYFRLLNFSHTLITHCIFSFSL